MRKPSEYSYPPVVGRSKAVLIRDDTGNTPVGIVSEVVARPTSEDKEGRLVFRGPVRFKEQIKAHLETIILALVDRITEDLGLPRRSYEASVVNIGATASSGLGFEIGGFSADLPVFLALLSSSLHIGLRQDTASTGHIASLDGDIAPVRGIPVKFDAVLASPGITGAVIPDLDKDISLKVLTPIEYQAAKESLLAHKGKIKIYQINHVYDAVKIFMTDETIVTGSLETGFFKAKTSSSKNQSPVYLTSNFLSDGNEKRFWNTLEHLFLNPDVDKAKSIIKAYVDYHIENKSYPEAFGEQLFRLLLSLPPAIRKLDDLFPLLSMDLCIKLSQYAGSEDYEDVRQLNKATFGEGFGEIPLFSDEKIALERQWGEGLFEGLLSELSRENLSHKIGQAIDEGRASYPLPTNIIKDGFEFNEIITAFGAHMLRHTGSPKGHLNKSAIASEAIKIVEKAFEHRGGFNAALAEGKFGTNGGMRVVLDIMTEHLKQEEMGNYANMVFKKALDPLEGDSQVKLMEVFQKHIAPELPANLRDLPPEQLAGHWEEIIRCYVESIDKVTDLMKRL